MTQLPGTLAGPREGIFCPCTAASQPLHWEHRPTLLQPNRCSNLN